jgi:DDE superfamily endonuclease
MMAVIETVKSDSAATVKERLERFAREVLAEAMNRPAQMENGGLYLRGLIEEGKRKSLEPMVERLGADADYQSMQQFLTDSPWDPAELVRAVAERVASEIEILAWVLDDTGFPGSARGTSAPVLPSMPPWAPRASKRPRTSWCATRARRSRRAHYSRSAETRSPRCASF